MTTTITNDREELTILSEDITANAKYAGLTSVIIADTITQASPDQLRFLASYLQAEADSRRESKRRRLITGARLPSMKTLDTYDWEKVVLPPTITRENLANLDFTHRHEDIICYGNVGCGKTHLASALIRLACHNNMKARFTTAADLIMTLRKAKNDGRLDKELTTWSKFELIAIDELGYLPIDPEGARLLFQVISNTYERSSLIITTNIEFSRWGTIFGDDNIAAAIINRLIHHGHLLRHQGQSWRLTHALMK